MPATRGSTSSWGTCITAADPTPRRRSRWSERSRSIRRTPGGNAPRRATDRARTRAAELNPSIARAEKNLSLDRFSAARYDELVGDRAPRPEVVDGALAHYN